MFCKYCGNEVEENTVVCPKCGCLISENMQESENITMPIAPSRKFFRLTRIFSILGMVLGGISLACGFLFFFLLLLGIAVGEGGGLILVIYSVCGLLGMFLVSPFALTAGILAFVFKKKSAEPTGALPIVAFVLGVVSFVVGWGSYLIGALNG